ncbi:hypothetical protein Cyast_0245 [Cyanobacterium stanieri PCC 7202]|uniref:DUF4382 domain-containing protein n=1 Tax=Cyanobacterium stanieri (strain ATCC 29140 / PCC 7202) TaxID=292563 RepID=K9YH06_CYASC|nr:hypothetical protein Cyast_0245 [Cyanobacterium stanieri PCC 7202]
MIKSCSQFLSKILIPSAMVGITLIGCGSPDTTQQQGDGTLITPPDMVQGGGFLQLMADGEDFIIEGFETKDGWDINFDHVYITVNDVIAYQTNPPFEAESDAPLEAQESVNLIVSPTTVDLMLGRENNPAILVTEIEAPPGHYNAISWQMYNQADGASSLRLLGRAEKDGQEIQFNLNFPMNIAYTCGEFVGDERKGIVNEGETAEIHMTFHFDHIFGDAGKDDNHEVNVNAPGFEPMANLAENGTLDVDLETLQNNLSEEDYQRLENSILELGHVGEGHCRITEDI